MRILVIAAVSDRSESHLYTELVKHGCVVDIVTDPRETRGDFFRDSGLHVEQLKIAHRFDLSAIRALRKKISKNRYDVIYSPFNKGLATAAIASLGVKTKLVTYRGTLGNISRLNPSDYLTHLNPRLSAIACNCEAVKDSLLPYGISSEKLWTVYKGHETAWYNTEAPLTKKDLGIPEEASVFGCIANIRPLKGVDVLLQSFAKLSSEQPSHLVLVGEIRDDSLKPLVTELGLKDRVHFLGFRKDASRIAGMLDVAVMASTRREGVPRSVIESMSQGVPAVVTDVGGMPELVGHEIGGLVVEPRNAQQLSSALVQLLQNKDLRLGYGQGAKARIEEVFSVNKYVNSMLALFSTVVKSS